MSRLEVILPRRNQKVVFHPRSVLSASLVGHPSASLAAVPATALPCDGTNNMGFVDNIDHNDQYGICGGAMADHGDNILTYAQGKRTQVIHDPSKLLQQYLTVSGGDNGLYESQVVNQIWKVGIAGDKDAVIQDSLDFDVTNLPLTRYIIDQFYFGCMAWSVPDAFINNFNTGVIFDNPMIPDPNKGHYVILTDLDSVGRVRNVTWGDWCWCGPAMIASVDPQCFCVFSSRAYDPATGLDSKGRHVAVQGAKWITMGGNAAIVAKVVAMFPAAGPTPLPPGPGPSPAPVEVVGKLEAMITSGFMQGVKIAGTVTTPVAAHAMHATYAAGFSWQSLTQIIAFLETVLQTIDWAKLEQQAPKVIADVVKTWGDIRSHNWIAVIADVNQLSVDTGIPLPPFLQPSPVV